MFKQFLAVLPRPRPSKGNFPFLFFTHFEHKPLLPFSVALIDSHTAFEDLQRRNMDFSKAVKSVLGNTLK